MRKRVAGAALALALAACAPPAVAPQPPAADPAETPRSLAPNDIETFFDCLQRESAAVASAHRAGPSPGFAENAIDTMRNTLAQAPALLEIDVAQTADGALVLMHDDTVDRTTNGRGAVGDFTLAEFQQLRLRDNQGLVLAGHPPTLAEALDAGRDTILQLDVKRGVPFEDVIDAVRAAGAQNRVIVITYNDDDALLVQRLAPELMISVSMYDEGDLRRLAGKTMDFTRVLAWTGTREPNAALNAALAQRGVESIFGTLGPPSESWDGRFARDRADQYAAFAETGLEVIATDRPIAAQRDLDAADGEGYAPLRCAAES